MITTWLPDEHGGRLVRWFAAENEADVQALMRSNGLPNGARATAEGQVLALKPGRYRVLTYNPENAETDTYLTVHAVVHT